jgi:hypothetical protein
MNYKEFANQELPFQGEFFLARNKKFKELIFFVHFYEGSKKQLLRHIRLVNSLGFDAFAFQLSGTLQDLLDLNFPISPKGKFGTKHVYADQIEHLLNLIPGDKIMYTFSNPSASAIEAMARRGCTDTVAMICDSGPTGRFMPSAQKLFQHNYNMKSWALSWALAPFLSVGWSPYFHFDLAADLKTFPDRFPILSIRGWKDELIPPQDIDVVFEPHQQLHWSKLSIPEAMHLKGLRDFKAEYTPGVERFLTSVATPND